MKRPKHRIIPKAQLRNELKPLFERHEEVKIAYLYGSYALERQNEFSDIDIGIVIEPKIEPNPLYFAKIASEIEQIFDYTVEADVRVLNNVPPRFLFKVINQGILIYCSDETFKNEVELNAIRRYVDIKPLLAFFDNAYLDEVFQDEN
ncbi:MAG: nucleotidyltransferase domain-containing protein [Promethearchaeia archaeon]